MKKPCIYVVGKPYPISRTVDEINRLGYSLGLFLDKNTTVKHPKQYERIIPLDFTGKQSLSQQLKEINNIEISGLYCLYENYIVAKAEIGQYYNIPTLSVDSALKCTDKHLMRTAFMAADPGITPLHAVVDSEEALLAFASTISYPLILKPTNLVKSLLVLVCNDQAELLSNYRYAVQTITDLYAKYKVYSHQPRLIAEEFIQGHMCSVAALVDEKGTPHFCESIVALTTGKERGFDDNFLYERLLPGEYSPELSSRIFETAAKGIKALGMTSSAAHVELIYTDTEIKIVEIGARTGGYRTRMYQESYNVNLLEEELRLAIGKQPQLGGAFSKYCSVFEIFPETVGTFKKISGDIHQEDYVSFKIKAAPGQTIGPAKHGYKAAAVIMASDPNKQRLDTMRQSVGKLKVEITK